MVENMLRGIDVRLNTDYLLNRLQLDSLADKVIYTGPIDALYSYRFGHLQYRSLRFETELLQVANYQGNAVVNYTDAEIPYTRIIEHKWFESDSVNSADSKCGAQCGTTVITREYPAEWQPGDEQYYPINDSYNTALYEKYKLLAEAETNIIVCGRLGEYKYYDMDTVVERALALANKLLS